MEPGQDGPVLEALGEHRWLGAQGIEAVLGYALHDVVGEAAGVGF